MTEYNGRVMFPFTSVVRHKYTLFNGDRVTQDSPTSLVLAATMEDADLLLRFSGVPYGLIQSSWGAANLNEVYNQEAIQN